MLLLYIDHFSKLNSKICEPTSDSEALNNEAIAAFTAGNCDLAAELFGKALNQSPGYVPYLTNRALCYYRLGDANQVLDNALASIELDPTWVKGYFYKGKALQMLSNTQEAITCFQICCDMEQNNEDYKLLLQECLAQRKNKMPSSPPQNGVKHAVMCDACKCYPIIGTKYTCSVCSQYNLCRYCHSANSNQQGHDSTHPLTAHEKADDIFDSFSWDVAEDSMTESLSSTSGVSIVPSEFQHQKDDGACYDDTLPLQQQLQQLKMEEEEEQKKYNEMNEKE